MLLAFSVERQAIELGTAQRRRRQRQKALKGRKRVYSLRRQTLRRAGKTTSPKRSGSVNSVAKWGT